MEKLSNQRMLVRLCNQACQNYMAELPSPFQRRSLAHESSRQIHKEDTVHGLWAFFIFLGEL